MPIPLILASTSEARKSQLERLGIEFVCASSDVNEDELKNRRWPSESTARRLSIAKAKAVFDSRPETIVIGGDQVASCEGEIIDKPGSDDVAKRQLRRMSGRLLELQTGVAIIHPKGVESHVEPVRLAMRELTDDEINAYVERDRPLECAGCFRWESSGPLLFSRVETNDPTAILGLPILWLSAALRKLGYRLP